MLRSEAQQPGKVEIRVSLPNPCSTEHQMHKVEDGGVQYKHTPRLRSRPDQGQNGAGNLSLSLSLSSHSRKGDSRAANYGMYEKTRLRKLDMSP